jgi:hypothetical protein
VVVLPLRCLSGSDSRFRSTILSICRRRIPTPPERRRVVEQGKRSPIPKYRQLNRPTVTRHHSFQLRQRQLLGQPNENIDAFPGCTNNHQSRALRSRQCRARAFSNSPPVRTLPSIHTTPVLLKQTNSTRPLYLYNLPSSAQRGGTIRLTAAASFKKTQTRASSRITSLINSKLDDFFGLSEYDWTPATREDAPSMYLYELVNWLTTVVGTLEMSQW